LLLLLLILVGAHLFLSSRRLFYHFGAWFYCHH
jgi:hypothetical protein